MDWLVLPYVSFLCITRANVYRAGKIHDSTFCHPKSVCQQEFALKTFSLEVRMDSKEGLGLYLDLLHFQGSYAVDAKSQTGLLFCCPRGCSFPKSSSQMRALPGWATEMSALVKAEVTLVISAPQQSTPCRTQTFMNCVKTVVSSTCWLRKPV